MTSPMTKTGMFACLILMIAVACIPLTGEAYLVDLATEILVFVLFALSLNVLIGYSGNVSFGHAAYFAIGGYVNAILLTTYNVPLVIAMPVAVLASMVAAMFVGWFCTRLTDIYFAMLTLAFAMLVWAVAFKWRSMTNGDDGFVGVFVPELLGTRVPFFYFTFIVVAGTFAGIAGAIFAMYNRGMYVENAFWTQSAQVLIMVLLGGMYSFFGPAIGAAVLYVLERLTNEYTQYWPTVLGGILLVILLFLPDGIVGLAQKVKNRLSPSGGGGTG